MKQTKVAVLGFNKKIVEKEVLKNNFAIDRKDPDIVICYGGEGTFLYGEQIYPSVPKLFIYAGSENKKKYDLSKIIKKLKRKKYKKEKAMKLEASVKNKKFLAMNDINFHYKVPVAVRFDVYIDNKKIAENVIGDGLVIATPWGANAYYKSITGKTFERGIGLAFNNPTKKMRSKVVSSKAKIMIKVRRGPALLAADCNKKVIQLKTGDVVTIKKSDQKAVLLNMGSVKIGKR